MRLCLCIYIERTRERESRAILGYALYLFSAGYFRRKNLRNVINQQCFLSSTYRGINQTYREKSVGATRVAGSCSGELIPQAALSSCVYSIIWKREAGRDNCVSRTYIGLQTRSECHGKSGQPEYLHVMWKCALIYAWPDVYSLYLMWYLTISICVCERVWLFTRNVEEEEEAPERGRRSPRIERHIPVGLFHAIPRK